MRRLRGRLVSFVAQEPGEALNPAIRVGRQIGELLAVHTPQRDHRAAVEQALASVRLPSDRRFQRRFPHQLSGGQQQRVALAQAFVCEPSLVVLDEPTTGLDVVTQALLLAEIRRLREATDAAIVYISHDLATVATVADRIAVMYAGHLVEEGPTAALLEHPAHPYTAGLLGCLPTGGRTRVRP
ncbi:MAG: ATP-binding cassette domain-containing protein, partial [Egibacteraceae bacterium]